MTRAEHLFSVIGALDDELVEEAATPSPAVRSGIHWGRWAALAACALLAVGIWNLNRLRAGSAGGDAPETANAAPFQEAVEGSADYGNTQGADEEPQKKEFGELPVAGAPEAAGGAAPAEGPSSDSVQATPPPAADGGNDVTYNGETSALPRRMGSLAELNATLAAQIAEKGVPAELPVYRDGESQGLYPVTAAPQQKGETAPQLLYAAGEDGLTLPVWRLTLADGSTQDTPAVNVN